MLTAHFSKGLKNISFTFLKKPVPEKKSHLTYTFKKRLKIKEKVPLSPLQRNMLSYLPKKCQLWCEKLRTEQEILATSVIIKSEQILFTDYTCFTYWRGNRKFTISTTRKKIPLQFYNMITILFTRIIVNRGSLPDYTRCKEKILLQVQRSIVNTQYSYNRNFFL